MSYRSMLTQRATILRQRSSAASPSSTVDDWGNDTAPSTPVATTRGIQIPCQYYATGGNESQTIGGVNTTVDYNVNVMNDCPAVESDNILLDNGQECSILAILTVGRGHHKTIKAQMVGNIPAP